MTDDSYHIVVSQWLFEYDIMPAHGAQAWCAGFKSTYHHLLKLPKLVSQVHIKLHIQETRPKHWEDHSASRQDLANGGKDAWVMLQMMQLMSIQWTRPSFLPADAFFLAFARALVQLLLQQACPNSPQDLYIYVFFYYPIYLPDSFPRGLEVDLEGSSIFPILILLINIDRLGLFCHF